MNTWSTTSVVGADACLRAPCRPWLSRCSSRRAAAKAASRGTFTSGFLSRMRKQGQAAAGAHVEARVVQAVEAVPRPPAE